MNMITICHSTGEITLDISSITEIGKTEEKRNLMGDIFPIEYYFNANGIKYYLTAIQYDSLLKFMGTTKIGHINDDASPQLMYYGTPQMTP